MYELLKTIDSPADLRKLARKDLGPLAEELRGYVLESVAQTGGHLSSNLGTVELTIAIALRVQHAGKTGWCGTWATRPIRTRYSPAGASAWIRCASWRYFGFPRRVESEYDTLRTAQFLDLDFRGLRDGPGRAPEGRGPFRVAIIGDGAMTAGMAFEA